MYFIQVLQTRFRRSVDGGPEESFSRVYWKEVLAIL